MKIIRISRRGYLRQWKRFGAYLYERGVHHTRQPWSCIPAPTKGKGHHWYRRKQKKRYLRRMKRLEAMWARYKKQPRLTERQVKIKQRKQFIEELYRRIKIMAPYYRMRQKVFSCGIINVFEILKRKLAVKKWVLEQHLAEQKILVYQLSFLKSTSTMAGIARNVNVIDTLTKKKIEYAQAFKDALVQRKIINRRLAEKRKYFLNILVPLAEYYHHVKKYDNMTIPRYFSNVEKMVFQERFTQRRKAAEQRFLQVFGLAQMKYMELKAAAKEMGFFLRTRYYFTTGISRVLNQLNYAKDIVLDLLRDGHEILTKMFHYYDTFRTMEDTQGKLERVLEKRRLKAYYKRRQLEFEVEFLLERHKSYDPCRQCPSDICEPGVPNIKTDKKEVFAERLIEVFRGYRYLMNRTYIDDQTNNTMEQVWAKYPRKMDFLRHYAIISTMKLMNKLLHIQDENNRHLYFDMKKKAYADSIIFVFYSSILYCIRASIYLIYYRRLVPFAYDAEAYLVVKLMNVQEDQRLYEYAFRHMFKLTKRTPKYRLGMLGTHHIMFGGNRDKCVKLEFKFFRMFIAIRDSLLGRITRRKWATLRRNREEKKKLKLLISLAIHAKVNKEILKTFDFYTVKLDTICPLCCTAERDFVLKQIGERQDRVQNVMDIVASAQYYYLGIKTMDLCHDAEHCSQPAATFLLKIKILEERRKMAYLGRDAWIKF
ncbi:uncharacterized protein [Halyomorpha halys]|uniref:uncharacterized protein n=1 Tax=Halyomorpha halys TaxID=286706 RepID=UPI0006D4E1D8|nr:uncharacterized protein LOC106686112 [Halyomorpha halys]